MQLQPHAYPHTATQTQRPQLPPDNSLLILQGNYVQDKHVVCPDDTYPLTNMHDASVVITHATHAQHLLPALWDGRHSSVCVAHRPYIPAGTLMVAMHDARAQRALG